MTMAAINTPTPLIIQVYFFLSVLTGYGISGSEWVSVVRGLSLFFIVKPFRVYGRLGPRPFLLW